MTVELIADGVHLPFGLLALVYKVKGPDRIALTTDAMSVAGLDVKSGKLGSRRARAGVYHRGRRGQAAQPHAGRQHRHRRPARPHHEESGRAAPRDRAHAYAQYRPHYGISYKKGAWKPARTRTSVTSTRMCACRTASWAATSRRTPSDTESKRRGNAPPIGQRIRTPEVCPTPGVPLPLF